METVNSLAQLQLAQAMPLLTALLRSTHGSMLTQLVDLR